MTTQTTRTATPRPKGLARYKRLVAGTVLERPARLTIRTCRNLLRRAGLYETRSDRNWRLMDRVLAATLSPDSNCIDIGANKGDMLRRLAGAAPRGRHFAFEPLPHLAEDLRRRFPNAEVHACALSDQSGSATFHHAVDRPGRSGLKQQVCQSDFEQITVDLKRLDDVIPEDLPIRFIKIDVEGAELQVFRGAKRTFSRNKPVIIFEFNIEMARQFDTGPEHIHAFLCDECGLSLHSLASPEPLSLDDFLARTRAADKAGYSTASDTNFLAKNPDEPFPSGSNH